MEVLLQASSSSDINTIILDIYRYKNTLTYECKLKWIKLLYINEEISNEILNSRLDIINNLYKQLFNIIHTSIYKNLSPDQILALFPSTLDIKLSKLCTKIIYSHLSSWNESSIINQISEAKLNSFNWRIDVKTSSNLLTHMTVPTIIIGMKIQEKPTHIDYIPNTKDIQFELGKDGLQTTIDGLLKIRDQLSSI